MDNRFKQLYTQINSVSASKLIYDDGELRIQGFDRRDSLVIECHFTDVLFVRVSDEGIRLRLIQEMGTTRSLVLLDEKSELLSWLLEETLHTRDIGKAKHFILLIGEEIVDVVSLSDPQLSKT